MKGRFEITTKVVRDPWRRPLVTLVGRLSAAAAMIVGWSLALKLGLEGPWLVFAPLAPLVVGALAVGWLLEEFWTVSLTVGADGIFVAQRLLSKEFFSYAEIERIDHDASSVTLHMQKKPAPAPPIHSLDKGPRRRQGARSTPRGRTSIVRSISSARSGSSRARGAFGSSMA